jgi:hypothetical protein
MTRYLAATMLALLAAVGCNASNALVEPVALESVSDGIARGRPASTGAVTANGWYEGEEIYYILGGVEEGVTRRGQNDLYLIGGDRSFQGNVAEFIPGEAGYSPHWNVHLVHTAPGVTLDDIVASPYVSEHYSAEPVLFDDVEDILAAEVAGLVTIEMPGTVVLCPVISEQGAEAPGNTQLSEDFPPFPQTF